MAVIIVMAAVSLLAFASLDCAVASSKNSSASDGKPPRIDVHSTFSLGLEGKVHAQPAAAENPTSDEAISAATSPSAIEHSAVADDVCNTPLQLESEFAELQRMLATATAIVSTLSTADSVAARVDTAIETAVAPTNEQPPEPPVATFEGEAALSEEPEAEPQPEADPLVVFGPPTEFQPTSLYETDFVVLSRGHEIQHIDLSRPPVGRQARRVRRTLLRRLQTTESIFARPNDHLAGIFDRMQHYEELGPREPSTDEPTHFCGCGQCPDGVAASRMCAFLTIHRSQQRFHRRATASPASNGISRWHNPCFATPAFGRQRV